MSDLLGLPCIHGEDATVCEQGWADDPGPSIVDALEALALQECPDMRAAIHALEQAAKRIAPRVPHVPLDLGAVGEHGQEVGPH